MYLPKTYLKLFMHCPIHCPVLQFQSTRSVQAFRQNTSAPQLNPVQCCYRIPQTTVYILGDRVVVEQGLTSHQTHYRSYRGRVLWVKRPNQQCQSTEGREVLRTRLQSHCVHPTVLTITQHICSMKKAQNTHR